MNASLPTPNTVELLSTKIAAPRLRSPLVARAALLNRLDRGLDGKLTLISAPAGFGKTTLVSAWIAQAGHRLASAWVSLDDGDDDPVCFWRYLIAACQRFAPGSGLGDSALNLLQMPQQVSFEAALTLWINQLSALDGRYVLILEDYHLISSQRIHDTLAFLLDHLPATLHLVITSRTDPPLPLARLRVRAELCELHAADLRFSTDETRAFMEQLVPFAISAETIARLETHTEGWAAGLRLAALALHGREEAESLLATFDGTHKHVTDYLISEVFARQPAPIQQFLLETAFLSRLSANLCDSVTGRSDGAAILDALEHANLFLTTGDGQWYRYHALFSEAMQHYAGRSLGADSLRDLYHRASLWYEDHALAREAVEAALDALEYDRAATLLEYSIKPFESSNELHTLCRLIERLPEAVLRDHPDVCLIKAVAVLFTSNRRAPSTWAAIQTPLEWAETCYRSEGRVEKVAEVLAFRGMAAWWQDDPTAAFESAHQAVALLRDDQVQWRAVCAIALGMEGIFSGDLDTARRQLLDAQSYSTLAGNEYGKRAALSIYGDVLRRQTDLYGAEQVFHQVFAEAKDDPSDQHSALVGLAGLAYEWNDLDAAERDAKWSLEIAYAVGEHELIARSTILLIRIALARGQTAQAQRWLSLTERLPNVYNWAHFWPELRACRARLSFLCGEIPSLPPETDSSLRIIQQQTAILKTRITNAQGDTAHAITLLDQWQPRDGSQIDLEMLILRSLAHYREGALAQAKQSLVRALLIAQLSDYRRIFLDEGGAMAALLQETLYSLNSESLRDYVRRLLADFGYEQPDHDAVPTVEPLSPQEHRVLTLLSSGLTNPEIAQELVVSINTVKTQVKSIYRKLNVSSRQQACTVLRSMNAYMPRA